MVPAVLGMMGLHWAAEENLRVEGGVDCGWVPSCVSARAVQSHCSVKHLIRLTNSSCEDFGIDAVGNVWMVLQVECLFHDSKCKKKAERGKIRYTTVLFVLAFQGGVCNDWRF